MSFTILPYFTSIFSYFFPPPLVSGVLGAAMIIGCSSYLDELLLTWLCQQFAIENGPFIVSFPIDSMVIFHSYVNVYQRVYNGNHPQMVFYQMVFYHAILFITWVSIMKYCSSGVLKMRYQNDPYF